VLRADLDSGHAHVNFGVEAVADEALHFRDGSNRGQTLQRLVEGYQAWLLVLRYDQVVFEGYVYEVTSPFSPPAGCGRDQPGFDVSDAPPHHRTAIGSGSPAHC
jgi:hypothetical protein